MPEVKKLRLLNLAFINKIKKKRKQRFKQIVILWKDDKNGQKKRRYKKKKKATSNLDIAVITLIVLSILLAVLILY